MEMSSNEANEDSNLPHQINSPTDVPIGVEIKIRHQFYFHQKIGCSESQFDLLHDYLPHHARVNGTVIGLCAHRVKGDRFALPRF